MNTTTKIPAPAQQRTAQRHFEEAVGLTTPTPKVLQRFQKWVKKSDINPQEIETISPTILFGIYRHTYLEHLWDQYNAIPYMTPEQWFHIRGVTFDAHDVMKHLLETKPDHTYQDYMDAMINLGHKPENAAKTYHEQFVKKKKSTRK